MQLFSYLDSGLLHTTMAKPTDQEKVEQIFMGQPKNHQVKSAINNKTVSTNTADLQAFFEQCQAADKSSGKLDQIKKDKDESKKKTERGTARRSAHSDRDSHRNARHYHDGDRDNHGRRRYGHYRDTSRYREHRRGDYHRGEPKYEKKGGHTQPVQKAGQGS